MRRTSVGIADTEVDIGFTKIHRQQLAVCAQRTSQARQALGIAEYHGPRSQMMREIANPTMLHDGSGMGALVGSMAALLAMDGFAGAPAITVEADAAEEFWSDLGDVWTIERNYIKPYPICRWAHAALDALSGLIRENGFAADDVTMIEVNTFAGAAALFPGMPATTSQAQYSLPFALAAMLVHGRIGPGDISGAALSDPKVAEVLSRVAVREDAHTLYGFGRRQDRALFRALIRVRAPHRSRRWYRPTRNRRRRAPPGHRR